MNDAGSAGATQGFEWDVLARIPLAAAMRIRVAEYNPTQLVLAALQPAELCLIPARHSDKNGIDWSFPGE